MFKLAGKNLVLLFLVVGIVASFVVGFSIGTSQEPLEGITNTERGKPTDVDFSIFWDAWRVVQERFAATKPLDHQGMVYGAIAGMVESLGDPYTVFMDPKEAKKFAEDLEGSFEGVGMEIGIRNRELRVIAPLEGTPAKAAGLRAGDRILKIDDTFTRDLSIDEAMSLIRGPKGTAVTLSIFRDTWNEPKDFVIERAVIIIPSLKWKLLEGNVAHIQLFQFSEKAKADFAKAAKEIAASGATSLVVDVRGNPGGFLSIAIDIAGWFLQPGDVVVIEDFAKEGRQEVHKATGNAKLFSYPTVVLVNEGSASASEILAGALRDNRSVTLIGEKSFGKGSVQSMESLPQQSALKVTIANWLTPKGNHISEVGLMPDIEVKMTSEDYDKDLDPQLDRAVEFLSQL